MMSFQTTKHLITCLLALQFLLLPTLIPTNFTVQGRQFFFSQPTHDAALLQKINEELKVVKMRSLIGSKPPKCNERCTSCGHCEAVQVPIASLKSTSNYQFHATYSRGDGINSNYKPMCWKCKCGDFLFNPWY